MADLAELCARIHAEQEQTPEIAIFLTDDVPAMKVATAWSQMPVAWKAPSKTPPQNGQLLGWLWRGREVNLADLVARSSLPRNWVARSFETLKSSGLILPDGSLSKWALAVIRGRVAASAGRKKR